MMTKDLSRCRVCGRALKNPESIAAGVGPVCAGPKPSLRAARRKNPDQYELFSERKEAMNNVNPSTAVKNELTKVEQLKSMLADEGVLFDENGDVDAQLLLDTIEGETDLHDMLLEIDEAVAEYELKADAVKARIEQMQKRKARLEKSSETLRTIILSAMDKAGIKKIEGPVSTLSVGTKPRALIITDESLIPSDYFEAQKPKLNKKMLIDSLKENTLISGAELDNGGIKLTIRRV